MTSALPPITPMALGRRSAPFNDRDWVCELKWDGLRGLAYIDQGRCHLQFRNGNALNGCVDLPLALGQLPASSAILDGEVVCLDLEGKPDFNALTLRRRDPFFYAFDLLWLNGADLRGLPLARRKQALAALLTGAPDEVRCVHHINGHACELFYRLCCEHDLEGVVVKRLDSTYLDADHESAWLTINNPTYFRKRGSEYAGGT